MVRRLERRSMDEVDPGRETMRCKPVHVDASLERTEIELVHGSLLVLRSVLSSPSLSIQSGSSIDASSLWIRFRRTWKDGIP